MYYLDYRGGDGHIPMHETAWQYKTLANITIRTWNSTKHPEQKKIFLGVKQYCWDKKQKIGTDLNELDTRNLWLVVSFSRRRKKLQIYNLV